MCEKAFFICDRCPERNNERRDKNKSKKCDDNTTHNLDHCPRPGGPKLKYSSMLCSVHRAEAGVGPRGGGTAKPIRFNKDSFGMLMPEGPKSAKPMQFNENSFGVLRPGGGNHGLNQRPMNFQPVGTQPPNSIPPYNTPQPQATAGPGYGAGSYGFGTGQGQQAYPAGGGFPSQQQASTPLGYGASTHGYGAGQAQQPYAPTHQPYSSLSSHGGQAPQRYGNSGSDPRYNFSLPLPA